MENALSYISVLPQTKEQRMLFVEKVVNEITSGEYNPLHVEVWLKSVEETIKQIRANRDVKTAISDELYKYSEKSVEAFGAIITKAKRTIKDYSNCNDAILNELENESAKIEEQINARKKMLDTGVNPETGETFAKPTESITEFWKIQIK